MSALDAGSLSSLEGPCRNRTKSDDDLADGEGSEDQEEEQEFRVHPPPPYGKVRPKRKRKIGEETEEVAQHGMDRSEGGQSKTQAKSDSASVVRRKRRPEGLR